MRRAWVRPVSESLAACALTWQARVPIDVARARAQHEALRRALVDAGYAVEQVPGDDALPDAVFVEDTAVISAGAAWSTRPGAASRRPEVDGVVAALRRWMRVIPLPEAIGDLDGGDVLVRGSVWYVGAGGRSTPGPALAAAVARHGIVVQAVPIRGCLHLKSAACDLGPAGVLVNPAHVDPLAFRGAPVIEVDPDEPTAANALRLGRRRVLVAEGAPRTRRRLEQAGLEVRSVAVDELAKAEGAVTCCSLVSG